MGSGARITIVHAGGLVVMCAIMLAPVASSDTSINGIVHLLTSLVLPLHLLMNSRRSPSLAETASAALAMAYLAWGALLYFEPGRLPGPWPVFDAIHWVYWSMGHRLGQKPPPDHRISVEIIRWNWGLLATLYAIILIRGAVALCRGQVGRVGFGGSSSQTTVSWPRSAWLRGLPPAAELVLALWLTLCWLPCLSNFGLLKCGWPCPVGLAGSLILSMAAWRPRPSNWRLSRFVVRLARLVPASASGVMSGLAWSLWGWGASILTATIFIVIVILFARLSSRRRHGTILVRLLARFWGFAISAEIVKDSANIIQT